MDPAAIDALRQQGIEPFGEYAPYVPVQVDDDGSPVGLEGHEVPVALGEHVVLVPLKPVGELFAGDRRPPNMNDGYPDDYVPFFYAIEYPVAVFCSQGEHPVRDQELERLYRRLGKRPDGTDRHPLFSYLWAAARLHMSLHDVSRAELEAVARRLSRSARTYAMGPTSHNYYDFVSRTLLGDARYADALRASSRMLMRQGR